MHVARLSSYVATAVVVAGGLLLLVTVASTVNAIRLLSEVLESPRLDFYFVVPPTWNGLLLYGVGVVGDLIFRGTAVPLGRPARTLWQTHLVVTTLLILVALAAGAVAPSDWRMALVLNGLYVVMLVAHGTALVLGGMLFLRAAKV